MNKILRLTNDEFNSFIRGKKVLGTGSEGPVYDLNNGFALKHLKDPIIMELQINAENNYEELDLLQFSDISSKCYYFPVQLIYVDDEIEAHISRKCNGYNICLLDANSINLKKLSKAIKEFNEDTLLISNKGITGYDMRYNFLYDGNSFGAVDTTFYYYSDNDPDLIYKSNIASFNDDVSSLLVEKNFMHFINQSPKLLELYNAIKHQELLDLNEFLYQFRQELSLYVDKDVTYLSDAKKVARKNYKVIYPNTPKYFLKNN